MSDEMILCPSCGHPVRQHGEDGCTRGDCLCELTKADLAPKPVVTETVVELPPATSTTLDPLEVDVDTIRRSLMWWDAWHCMSCYGRFFTDRSCCGRQAVPVRVLVLPRGEAA